MNAYQYRKLFGKSKYGAKKVEQDGVVYDSKKEAKRAAVLKEWERFGIITGLRQQVDFELQPGYTNNRGQKIRPIIYRADFVYQREGKLIVEDTKGFRTDVYKLKKKLFEYQYPAYTFVES